MVIQNERRETITITFWDDAARQLSSCLGNNSERTIVVITALIVKDDGGMVALSSTKGTNVYVDLDVPDADKLKLSLQAPPTRKRTFIPAVEPKQILYVKQLLKQNATLASFVTQKSSKFTLMKDGIIFPVLNAAKKTNLSNERYWCKECNAYVNNPIYRYRLQIRIKDASGEIDATAFEEAAVQMAGLTLDELSALNNDVDNEEDAICNQLETIIDKDYYFSLRITKYNIGETTKPVTVSRAWSDEMNVSKKARTSTSADLDVCIASV